MIMGFDLTYNECVDNIKDSIFSVCYGRSVQSPFAVYYCDGGYVKKMVFRAMRAYCYDTDKLRRMCVEKKKEFSKIYFGDEDYVLHIGNTFIAEKLDKCVGKPVGSVVSEMNRYYEERLERYLENINGTRRWKEFRDKYGDYVIGVDRDVDIYPTGFSVRVLFQTDKSFEERKKFVKSHSKEIVEYVIGELEDSKRVMRRIGDMRFYKPVMIATLRAAEADVKFEVKREIA